jgi:putative membrane protein
MGFTIRILGNSAALYVASFVITGFTIVGSIKEFLISGVLLGLLNSTIKPVLKLMTMPIVILSLGLFIIVINALMLWVVDYLFDFIKISDIYTLVLATLVISLVNLLIAGLAKTLP